MNLKWIITWIYNQGILFPQFCDTENLANFNKKKKKKSRTKTKISKTFPDIKICFSGNNNIHVQYFLVLLSSSLCNNSSLQSQSSHEYWEVSMLMSKKAKTRLNNFLIQRKTRTIKSLSIATSLSRLSHRLCQLPTVGVS
jgi:hypothetical protein